MTAGKNYTGHQSLKPGCIKCKPKIAREVNRTAKLSPTKQNEKSLKISLAEDTISRDELAAAADFLTSGQRLTKGSQTELFEKEFADEVGAEYAVFVNSGSSANLLVVAALKESGRLRNNVVIAPAISWVTTVTPFMHLGFEVVLCDADPQSLGVDPVALEKLLKEHRPSVLIVVHVLGHSNDMVKIEELCEQYSVIIVEDTCEALGSKSHDGRALGTIGAAGTFSFYYGHHISTIEGGMVVTKDFELLQIMLSLRSHGWSRDLSAEFRSSLLDKHRVDDFQSLYTFFWPGFNFRSTDLQAFIGRGQIKRLSEIVKIREENFWTYAELLTDFWQQSSGSSVLSSFAYGTAVDNRSHTANKLLASGIESRPLICGNIGRHPFWTKFHPVSDLPVANFVHDFGIYLPNHAGIRNSDVKFIAQTFRKTALPANLR